MKPSPKHAHSVRMRKFIDTMRFLLRSDRGDTPTQVMIGAVVAIILIVPAMTFFTNFLATTSITAVDAERQKDLRSWSIEEFETKPWNEVLAVYESNQNQKADVDSKFNFGIRYAVDALDSSGGFVIKLVAPRANVNESFCNDPRGANTKSCIYYQYTKTPTLSEGLPPSWTGMNYGQADVQPATGTNSPTLDVNSNRVVNIGTFDGCAATTPDRLRITFKWESKNGLRPSSVQHLVIADKLFETVPLSSTNSSNTIWYSATINKPQPSTCFNAEKVRIVVDNGARGTISDLFVAQLLSECVTQDIATGAPGECIRNEEGSTDANVPHIVSDPAWASDGTNWYFTFQNPLTGPEVNSYQIRGTGTKAGCVTSTQTIKRGNATNGQDSILKIGSYASITALKAAACDRYYVTTIGTNNYTSSEISFLTAGINKVVSVDAGGSQVAPGLVTNPKLSSTATQTKWSLKFDHPNVAAVDHFNVVGKGTNPKCDTVQKSVTPAAAGSNVYSLGTFTNEADMRASTCESFRVTAVGKNGQTGNPVIFTTKEITQVENL